MDAGIEKRNKPSETIAPGENQTQSELPDELWEQIISKLTLKDNVRTSAVNKRFLSIATSVQKANKPPWLVIPPKSGDSYKFYDPSKRKCYSLNLPELRGLEFVHSKDGWLLMGEPENARLFLFYPYTRELIQLPELPNLSLEFINVCFSAAPTSPECVVLTIHFINFHQNVEIFTFRPGETRWTNVTYHYNKELYPTPWDKLLFCNGLFYYFSCYNDVMGIYNPDESSWCVEDIPTHEDNTTPFFFSDEYYWPNLFMAEHDGEIFITHTFADKSPVIYKLDLPNQKLFEMETLGGMTLFISYLSTSHVRTDVLGNMRNKICLPKVHPDGERCISYSFHKGVYFPENKLHYWRDIHRFRRVWIDAPKEDLSTVI